MPINFMPQPDLQVCSNHNETFPTDCHLHQMRCLCQEGDPRCKDQDKYQHSHVEYYGELIERP